MEQNNCDRLVYEKFVTFHTHTHTQLGYVCVYVFLYLSICLFSLYMCVFVFILITFILCFIVFPYLCLSPSLTLSFNPESQLYAYSSISPFLFLTNSLILVYKAIRIGIEYSGQIHPGSSVNNAFEWRVKVPPLSLAGVRQRVEPSL